MTKVLMVISERGFRDEEFGEPFKILKAAGHSVTVAGSSPREASGMLGMRVKPDAEIDSVNPSDYDAVVVVGGSGTPTHLWPSKALQQALRTVYERNGVVAAICLAPVTLARAGLIKGRRCTVYRTPESISEMEKGGCMLQRDQVVVDGRIVTADGPTAAKTFGEAIIKLLGQ
jgi:protease I